MNLFEYIKAQDKEGMAKYLARFTIESLPEKRLCDPKVIPYVIDWWKQQLEKEVDKFGHVVKKTF